MDSKQQTTGRRVAMNWWTAGAMGAGMLLASMLAGSVAYAVTAAGQDCNEVVDSQLKACQNSAKESYWLAIARCDNDAADDPRGLCPASASTELKAAQSDCTDQLAAREQICGQLGGGKFNPVINPANFSTNISNPYFPLKPGTKFVYEGATAAGFEHVEFVVTRKTRLLSGVKCVEVHDTSAVDGVIVEDTLDWFAQDKAGNVWYFGEDSKQYADGFLVGIDGSWRAGVDDAKPGIVMKANPKLKDVYRQEFAISEAEDSAEVIALGQATSANGKAYKNALVTHEFSGLEPSANERKFYVPNVGNVLTIDDETGERSALVSVTTIP